MRRTPIAVLTAVLLFVAGFAGASAAQPAPSATAAATDSTTVADAVSRVTATQDLQRAALAYVEQASRWRELAQRVTVLDGELYAVTQNAATPAEPLHPIDRDRELRALHRAATAIVDDLGAIVRRVEHEGSALEADARKWHERVVFLESRRVPAPVLERARSIETEVSSTYSIVKDFRDSVLLGLDRALALRARIDDARTLVARNQEQVRLQREELEQSPLWRLGATPADFALLGAELRPSWRVLRDYLSREGAALAGLFFGVLAVTAWLFMRRSATQARSVQRAYGRPIAASLLVALMTLGWLAPDPPRLFYEALFVLVPIPAAMVARRALRAQIPLTLYGLALATMLLPLRGAVDASAAADRFLLLLQAVSVGVPVAIDLRHGRLRQALWRMPSGVVRVAALLVIAAALVAAFHVVFGFTGPARFVRAGVGSLLGFGLVFGTTAVALYGATLSLLSTAPAQSLRSARDADPALIRAVRGILTALAIASVVLVTLGSLGLIPALRSGFESLMGATLEVGSVSIAASAVVTALAVVLATIILTAVTGFILDREIVPRLRLRPGAGYAIVTFTRWSMLIAGGALTLAALGIDMAKVTLLAGALSVGIGFGLQNVVNNFVSGLILIVERPVGVGDVIERGALSGTVTRIGIRSSIVRTGQGAEVIVPNADLVSKEVVNWTRSDPQRRYDFDISVATGSEPEQVMRVLVAAAGDVADIMTNPEPRAVFKGFSGKSLDFTLLTWVPTVDAGPQAQNALRVAVLHKLAQAGIAVA
jgi:small-conductance mechanosensitive channel